MNELWVRVLNPFGYHDHHNVGEVFKMRLEHVNKIVKDGFVEIVVNNVGKNSPNDDDEGCSICGNNSSDEELMFEGICNSCAFDE